MKNKLKEFDINFSGLKLGDHSFDYQYGNEFFEDFEYREFEDADFKANLVLTKKESSLELNFKVEGKVKVHCDVTNDLFWLPLKSDTHIQVKFGEEFDDTHDEILVLPDGEHKLNVAQYLYELPVLAKPLKVVNPEVESGKKGQEILKKLEKLSPENNDSDKEEDNVDPRWNKLKELLN